ncbi:MAG TPA: helix-turn-helix domain-containing protein [Polyangia bacterium]|jgi:excisionase family DNA binding protein
MQAPDDPEVLNYPQTAAFCGFRLGTLYSLVSRKRIPHLRLGKRLVRFRRSELEKWLDEHRVEPTHP